MAIDAVDLRKAAVWSVIAALAHVLLVTVGHLAYPYLRDALLAFAYGLMLPAIAVLHPRHAALRPSGAILGTIGGTSAVVLGLAGSVNVDLQPAALFVLGMWWWVWGKLWVETGVLRGDAGWSTAALAVIVFAASFLSAFAVAIPIVRPDLPYIDVWRAVQLLVAGWLIGLAVHLRAVAGHTMGR